MSSVVVRYPIRVCPPERCMIKCKACLWMLSEIQLERKPDVKGSQINISIDVPGWFKAFIWIRAILFIIFLILMNYNNVVSYQNAYHSVTYHMNIIFTQWLPNWAINANQISVFLSIEWTHWGPGMSYKKRHTKYPFTKKTSFLSSMEETGSKFIPYISALLQILW